MPETCPVLLLLGFWKWCLLPDAFDVLVNAEGKRFGKLGCELS